MATNAHKELAHKAEEIKAYWRKDTELTVAIKV
jgi:hypothetical protein